MAVVGAGAFGGWSALALLRAGVQVTLVDAWGPGNGRASSGGDTRVIRTEYGPQIWYTQMAARAQALWRESQARWNRPLYQRTGLILMVSAEDEYHRAALTVLHHQGIGAAALSPAEAARRFPEVDFSDVQWVLWEEDAGYLRAREACRAVVEAFVTEGGTYRTAAARPGRLTAAGLDGIELSDGTRLVRDTYVFACGPWLPRLFPDVLGDFVTTSRQEVFYFATPEGDSRFDDDRFPVWAHHGERFFYGIPGNDGRGFKIADDTRGPPFDPTRRIGWCGRRPSRGSARIWAYGFRRWRTPHCSRRECASTPTLQTETLFSIGIRARTTPGWWVAAPGTGSSTDRRSESSFGIW